MDDIKTVLSDFMSIFWNGLDQLDFFHTGFTFKEIFLTLVCASLIIVIFGRAFANRGGDYTVFGDHK